MSRDHSILSLLLLVGGCDPEEARNTRPALDPGPSVQLPLAGPHAAATAQPGAAYDLQAALHPQKIECDVFAQDCMEGEKCTAYAEGGGSSWNATKCVPVVTSPKVPGDLCTVEGNGVSGIDDCAAGSMCWDVDEMNQGTCVALCTGTIAAPSCDVGSSCAVANDGVLNLCLPQCDPIVSDCEEGDVCIPWDGSFICALDASGEDAGDDFDPCEFANACDPRYICAPPSLGLECDANADGCCLPYCDLTAPTCPGLGQDCLPFFDPESAPPQYENVGVCGLAE